MTENKVPDIAFEEEGIGDAPDVLYRVAMTRTFSDRDIHHINWFATEKAARDHVERIESQGKGCLIAFAKYVKTEEQHERPEDAITHKEIAGLLHDLRDTFTGYVLLEGEEADNETVGIIRRDFERRVDDWFYERRGDCHSCWQAMPRFDCPQSKRICGHHCNHTWTHDECCWCSEYQKVDHG